MDSHIACPLDDFARASTSLPARLFRARMDHGGDFTNRVRPCRVHIGHRDDGSLFIRLDVHGMLDSNLPLARLLVEPLDLHGRLHEATRQDSGQCNGDVE